MANKFDNVLDKLIAEEQVKNETPAQWEARHKDHVTEPWTPDYPHETECFHCHDCNERGQWKGQKKINQE